MSHDSYGNNYFGTSNSIWKIEERIKDTNPAIYKCLVVIQVPDDTPFKLVEKFNENIKSTNAEYADNNSRLRQSSSINSEQLVNVDSDSSEEIYIDPSSLNFDDHPNGSSTNTSIISDEQSVGMSMDYAGSTTETTIERSKSVANLRNMFNS